MCLFTYFLNSFPKEKENKEGGVQSCTITLRKAQNEKATSSATRSLHFYDFVGESSPWPFLSNWRVSLHGMDTPPCHSKPTWHEILLTQFLMPHLSWPQHTWLMSAGPDCVPPPPSVCQGSPCWCLISCSSFSEQPRYGNYAQMHCNLLGKNPTLRLAETCNNCFPAGNGQEKVCMKLFTSPHTGVDVSLIGELNSVR